MTTEAQVSQSYILYLFGADKCHPSFSYIDSLDRTHPNVDQTNYKPKVSKILNKFRYR